MLNKKVANFQLPATGDQSISLADLKGKNVVLYFYPKDATPGCTTEAQQFRDLHGKFVRQLLERIVTQTDGVPLFIEELTKAVLETGFLQERDDHYMLSGMAFDRWMNLGMVMIVEAAVVNTPPMIKATSSTDSLTWRPTIQTPESASF